MVPGAAPLFPPTHTGRGQVMQKSLFISFEGPEGAGKTTIMAMLDKELRALGNTTLLTREPGGCRLGHNLRSLLLAPEMGDIAGDAELFLFLADRAQHIAEVVKPALAAGKIVLCDRYADSTIAYQGHGRGMAEAPLLMACRLADGGLEPDITFLLDLPVETGLERATSRNNRDKKLMEQSRFDAEAIDFHHRVRQGYLKLAARHPDRIAVIDATRPPAEVLAACMSVLAHRLPGTPPTNGDENVRDDRI